MSVHHKPTILIVADIAEESVLLQDALSDFACETVPTFWEASDRLSQYHYDMMLLDLRLADKEKPEDTLRELPGLFERCRNPHLWVIVVTAYATSASAWEALRNERIYDYLVKPVAMADLEQTVRMALAHQPRLLALNRYVAIAQRIDRVQHAIPGHAERVAQLAVTVLRYVGLPESEVQRCRILGPLHDIGKLGLDREWQQLLHDQSLHSISDIDASLASLGSDKRLVQLIPRLFRFEAALGHYYETFLTDADRRSGNGQEVGLAAALAAADAYDVFTFCHGRECPDDAVHALLRQGFARGVIDALSACVEAGHYEMLEEPDASVARSGRA